MNRPNRKTGKGHQNGASPSRKNGVASAAGYLKIGDVAELVGISASLIRSWERLGLISPQRTGSQYRLYTNADVRILKRARFLARVKRLNAPAIVELLKNQGRVKPGQGANGNGMGLRLRQLRATRGYSLADVANEVGISVGFLSAIERSSMSASVSTLRKLAKFYRLNILDFFGSNGSRQYRVTVRDRKQLDAGPGVRMELLAWGNTVMEPHLFRIAPGAGSGESYAHEGEEFLFLLQGALKIALEGQEYELKKGDSFYFESSTPHQWVNPGRIETVVLWVNTPPTF